MTSSTAGLTETVDEPDETFQTTVPDVIDPPLAFDIAPHIKKPGLGRLTPRANVVGKTRRTRKILREFFILTCDDHPRKNSSKHEKSRK